ncbi:hypothetical protein RND71_000445 [Anisodus tanguticus]|uniref:DUF4283 domain-containing protein n=1 Tax=Anisodus tanguticus TaxID=243964 RepID=A0AAE1SVZ6_9SOLA|nr:hypothetical protein RND71_000445 [Anisodus tanguticus]
MMEDEITERLHKFVMNEEENDEVAIEFSVQHERLWSKLAREGLPIKEAGWNFFQFTFMNKKSIYFGTPWLYDRYLLNIHPWEPDLAGDSSVNWMSRDAGRKIGHALGGVVDIVIPENERVRKHALILEEGADSTDIQPGLETNEHQKTAKSGSKGKRIMGLDGENDMVLPKDVEANDFVPMDATNYETRHQHYSDDGLTKTGSQAQIQNHEPTFADTLAGREAR